MKTDKILIVADDSPSSIKAIRYGFNLASRLGARIMLVSVIEPAMTIGNPDAGIFPDDALIALKAKTADFLSRMKKNYGNNVPTELLEPIGELQTTVIGTAVRWKAGLIVAGTHGPDGFISKLFSQDLADSIIHRSPIPVCVVPASPVQ